MRQTEWSTLRDLVLKPGLASCVPYSLGHRWLRYLASSPARYTSDEELSWHRAVDLLGTAAPDQQAFVRRYRLYCLTDWADLYLANTRGDGWLRRHVRRVGAPIPSEPVLALTFHFGAGLWAMRALGRDGVRPAWVHAPVSSVVTAGARLATWLGHWRVATVRRATKAPTISTPGAYARMCEWHAGGHSVTALIDAPAHAGRQASVVNVFGRPCRLANGLARFAVEQRLPVYLYTTTLSETADHRIMRGRYAGRFADVGALMSLVARWMESEIRVDPAAWHLWRFADQFFVMT